jgi:hypothetical protein
MRCRYALVAQCCSVPFDLDSKIVERERSGRSFVRLLNVGRSDDQGTIRKANNKDLGLMLVRTLSYIIH